MPHPAADGTRSERAYEIRHPSCGCPILCFGRAKARDTLPCASFLCHAFPTLAGHCLALLRPGLVPGYVAVPRLALLFFALRCAAYLTPGLVPGYVVWRCHPFRYGAVQCAAFLASGFGPDTWRCRSIQCNALPDVAMQTLHRASCPDALPCPAFRCRAQPSTAYPCFAILCNSMPCVSLLRSGLGPDTLRCGVQLFAAIPCKSVRYDPSLRPGESPRYNAEQCSTLLCPCSTIHHRALLTLGRASCPDTLWCHAVLCVSMP